MRRSLLLTSIVYLGSLMDLFAIAPRLHAQAFEVAGVLTAEAGQMNYNGAVGAFGADAVLAARRLELRGSYQRFGVFGGCMGGPCRFRDVVIREVGIGLPFRQSAQPLSGWVVGVGIGLSRERLDINRFALSAYLTRTWRPASFLALRVEGRVRSLKSPPGGESFPGATLRLGVGLVP